MVDHAPKSVLRRATFASVGALLARLLAALTGIVIARAVGPASFGVYAAVWALVELSASTSEAGLITGLKREGAQYPDRIPFLLGNTLVVRVAVALGLLLVFSLAQRVLVQHPEAGRIFVPLALTALGIIVTDSFMTVLQIEGRQRAAATLLVIRAACFFTGSLLLAILDRGLSTFAWLQSAVYLAVALGTGGLVSLRTPWRLRLRHIPTQVRGSLPFALSEILYGLYLGLPVLCLSALADEASVGYFAVAQRFVMLGITIGIVATHDAFLPSLFRLHATDAAGFRAVVASSQRVMLALGFAGAGFLYVCAEPVIVLLQGEEYRPAVLLLRVLCWYALLTFAALVADNALTAGDRMGTKLWTQAAALAVLLACAVGLTVVGGSLGTCAAVLAGGLATMVLQTLAASRLGLMSYAGIPGILGKGLLTVGLAIVSVRLLYAWPWAGPTVFCVVAAALWAGDMRREWTAA